LVISFPTAFDTPGMLCSFNRQSSRIFYYPLTSSIWSSCSNWSVVLCRHCSLSQNHAASDSSRRSTFTFVS
jgi:hypothetical protein